MLRRHAIDGAAAAHGVAYYMVTNRDYMGDDGHNQEAKIAAYEREMQQAQAMGIDAFALNVGGWPRETHSIRYTAEMFEAAPSVPSAGERMPTATTSTAAAPEGDRETQGGIPEGQAKHRRSNLACCSSLLTCERESI